MSLANQDRKIQSISAKQFPYQSKEHIGSARFAEEISAALRLDYGAPMPQLRSLWVSPAPTPARLRIGLRPEMGRTVSPWSFYVVIQTGSWPRFWRSRAENDYSASKP